MDEQKNNKIPNKSGTEKSDNEKILFSKEVLQMCLYGKRKVKIVHPNELQSQTMHDANGTFTNIKKESKQCTLGKSRSKEKLSHALESIPDEVQLCISSTSCEHYGICAKIHLPAGTWIGPYEGTRVRLDDVTSDMDRTFLWEIYKNGHLQHFIDGSNEHKSSWMRFIQCARHKDEQNLLAIQFDDNIFYKAFTDITPGTELLVWYDERYTQFMGIPLEWKETQFAARESRGQEQRLVPIQQTADPQQHTGEPATLQQKNNSALTANEFKAERFSIPKTTAPSETTNKAEPVISETLGKSNDSLLTAVDVKTQSMNKSSCTPKNLSGLQRIPDNIFIKTVQTVTTSTDPNVGSKIQTNDFHTLSSASCHLSDNLSYRQNILPATTAQKQGQSPFVNRTYTTKGLPYSNWTAVDMLPSLYHSNQLKIGNTVTTKSVECPVSSIKEFELPPPLTSDPLPPITFALAQPRDQNSNKNSESYGRTQIENKNQKAMTDDPGTSQEQSNSSNELTTSWRCRQCMKTFTQRVSLQMHVCSHHLEKPYQCGHCACSFSHHEDLRVHVETHVSDKPYRCGFCSRTFAGSTTLNNHMRTHTGSKPYSCKKCGKSFLKAAQLARHKRVQPSECRVTQSD